MFLLSLSLPSGEVSLSRQAHNLKIEGANPSLATILFFNQIMIERYERLGLQSSNDACSFLLELRILGLDWVVLRKTLER